jgi:hypothetical protein
VLIAAVYCFYCFVLGMALVWFAIHNIKGND